MRVAYRPVTGGLKTNPDWLNKKIQADSDAWYSERGVEYELLQDKKGFFCQLYQYGKSVKEIDHSRRSPAI